MNLKDMKNPRKAWLFQKKYICGKFRKKGVIFQQKKQNNKKIKKQ